MKDKARKTGVAVGGGIVLLLGIILIPYPGPGWLVVFAGLGILSTEFEWARRILKYARGKYDSWSQWVSRQSFVIKALIWLATAVIVVVTIWLLNGYGLINSWLHLNQSWAESPLF